MDKEIESARGPLLNSDIDFGDTHFASRTRPFRQIIWPWFCRNYLSISILGLLLYIAALLTGRSLFEARQAASYVALPQNALRYEDRPEWVGRQYPWNLNPSDELDESWENLLYSLNVRVTKEELQQLNTNMTNRIQISGGDYIGVLGVYHHLHCLNNLRRINTGPFSKKHSNHCIDAIRQSLMCHANTETHTGIWVHDPDIPHASALGSHAITTCVSWESLDNWARERALVPGTYSLRPGHLKMTLLDRYSPILA
ncbi:hypothetical protein F5Y10DRAFT_276213 [Nemania abortiva]|nr:hypothetical protein F5Y10DRAFT_276213 [Nemania abortiva]